MILALYFLKILIIIYIRYKNWIYFYRLLCLFLLHKLLGMYETSLIVDTSKHGWTMVRVTMMTLYLVRSCCQYQFVLDLIILIYSTFSIISPAFMTCLLTVLSSCNTYGYNSVSSPDYVNFSYSILSSQIFQPFGTMHNIYPESFNRKIMWIHAVLTLKF